MRRSFLPVLWVFFTAIGCQSPHSAYKQAAQERWNEARNQLALDLAHQQYESGQLAKATRTVEGALEINPQSQRGYLLRGQIYLAQNRPAAAQRSFETCLKLTGDHGEAHYNLGIIFENRGQLEKALSSYEKAWQSRREHEPYLLALVETLVAQASMLQKLKPPTGACPNCLPAMNWIANTWPGVAVHHAGLSSASNNRLVATHSTGSAWL